MKIFSKIFLILFVIATFLIITNQKVVATFTAHPDFTQTPQFPNRPVGRKPAAAFLQDPNIRSSLNPNRVDMTSWNCNSTKDCIGLLICEPDGGNTTAAPSRPGSCICNEWTGGSGGYGQPGSPRNYNVRLDVHYCGDPSPGQTALTTQAGIPNLNLAVGDYIKPIILSYDNGENVENVIWNIKANIRSGTNNLNYFSDNSTFFEITNRQAINITFYESFDYWSSDPNLMCQPYPFPPLREFTLNIQNADIRAEHPYNDCPAESDTTCNLNGAGQCVKLCQNRCSDTKEVLCNNTSFCSGPPTCTESNPQAPVLVSPANQAVLTTTNVTLRWNHSVWGTGCPSNNNRYLFHIVDKVGASCPTTNSTAWTDRGQRINYAAGINQTTMNNLLNNTTYCWFVRALNGSANANSPVWEFTIQNVQNFDSFFETFDGDVYVGGSIDQKLIDPLGTLNTSDTHRFSNDFNNFDSWNKLNSYRNIIAAEPPFLSSNAYIEPRNVTQKNLKSRRGSGVINNFIDRSAEEYAQNGSFFTYYYEKLKNRITAPNIKTVNGNAITYTVSNIDQLSEATRSNEKVIRYLYPRSTSGGNVTVQLRGLNSSNVNPQRGINQVLSGPDALHLRNLNDWESNTGTPTERINCDSRTLIFIQGNLEINADILNSNENASCTFIISGSLNIKLPDKYPGAGNTYSRNYRYLEGLFIARDYRITGRDDQGGVILHGSIITNNNTNRDNFHNIKTEIQNRPQDLYIYDPRHVVTWTEELQGNLTIPQVREERYIKLIQ